MPTERSIKEVETLVESFTGASIVIATNYGGMPVQSMVRFRRSLREKGAQYRITKNTLARIAADNAGRPEIKEIVEGPCGYVTTEGDAVVAASTLMSSIRAERLSMTVVGAVLGREVLSVERFETLASLPGRDVLLARLMGQMNAPITGLVTVLSGPIRALAIVLQRHIEQVGGAEESGEPEESEESA